MPYNGSIFELREKYHEIFNDDKFKPIDQEICESSRIYKISYSLNLLPLLCEHIAMNEDGSTELVSPQHEFLTACGQSDELQLFETTSMRELIQFKWDSFSKKFQLFGFMMHLFFLVTQDFFISEIYIKGHEDHKNKISIILAASLFYPLMYDTV